MQVTRRVIGYLFYGTVNIKLSTVDKRKVTILKKLCIPEFLSGAAWTRRDELDEMNGEDTVILHGVEENGQDGSIFCLCLD